jgi:arylsulfatase A-like enzyme
VGSKGNPYDESIRVPFIIRWPGRVPANRIADNNIGTMDLYPTLCGLAGITPPAHCGGQDFSPVMLGRPGPDPASQFILVNNFQRNYFRTQLDPDGPNIFHPFRGVRTKRYTFVVYAQGDWLLYDNQKDPYQMRNLINDPAYDGVQAELRKELNGWLARAEDPFIPAPWRERSVPDRIARQNRHYSLLPYRQQWDSYKADALAPYLSAAADDRQKEMRAAADRILDEPFFGRYKALHLELQNEKRNSKRPLDELKTELAALEAKYAALLKAAVEKINVGVSGNTGT